MGVDGGYTSYTSLLNFPGERGFTPVVALLTTYHISLSCYNQASLLLDHVNKISEPQDAIAMAQMRLFIFYQPPPSPASFRPIISEPSGMLAPVPILSAPTESQHAWQAAASL